MKYRLIGLILLLLNLTALPLQAGQDTPWGGEGELGFLMTSGNSETESFNGKFGLYYEASRWRHQGRFEALYNAEEKETETGGTTMEPSAEKYLVSAKSDFKFTETDYVFLTGSYEDDRFSGYDYQTSASAGYGRQLFKTERMLMEVEAGPGYRYNQPDSGNEEKEVILRAYALFTTQLSETSEFKQELSIKSGADQTVTKSTSAVKANILGALSMKTAFSLEHMSTVPKDTEKTDTETSVTLVYSF